MSMRRRLTGIALGLGLVLHGLGHAVLPMRAVDIVAPGVLAPTATALYVMAMLGFIAAGLGVLGVRPLTRAVVPIVMMAGVFGLTVQLWDFDASLWPGVVLSATLPILTTLYAVLWMPASSPPGRPWWKRVADALAVLFLVWIAAAVTLWPYHRSWGAAPHEWMLVFPGDPLPRTPEYEVLHAVTIDAPPAAVWPWLVQIGQDRAGFYSYDWLERLFLADIHNAREIRHEWQHRAPGDRVYATQPGYLGGVFGDRPGWRVVYVQPPRALVLEDWGAFVLEPTPDGRTRFLIRSTMSNPRVPVWGAAVSLTAFQLPHFIMQRRMMLTIKTLAEHSAAVAS